MKRTKLIKYLRNNNCFLLREGSKHSVYENKLNGKEATVPRHSEIGNIIANKICKDLDIPEIN